MKIFLSVGTHPQPFDRLLKELDLIAGRSKGFKIFGQIGNCVYVPKNFAFEKFLNDKQFQEKIMKSDLVISHGGAGTLINALRQGKKVIVVPRLEEFKEHTNNHQIDLAKAFEGEGKAIAVFEISDLEKAIKKAEKFKPKTGSNKEKLVKKVRKFIELA